jgi:hypothetical protein
MKYCPDCGSQLAIENAKFCSNCGNDLKKNKINDDANQTKSIKIENSKGDVIGVGVSGSGHTIGKNIVIGSGTINPNENQLQQIPDEYSQALKEFSEKINEQFKGQQIPEQEVKSINNSMNELAEEVKDIKQKPQEEKEIDYVKQVQIETKTASLIQKVLKILPQAAETASGTFVPLAPFSKLIGKGTQYLVDAITKRME